MPTQLAPKHLSLVLYGVERDTTWPVANGIEWKLRYAQEHLTREDLLGVASIVAAYHYLTDPALGPTAASDALRRARAVNKGYRHG